MLLCTLLTVFNPSLLSYRLLERLTSAFSDSGNMSDEFKHHTNQASRRFAGGVCGGLESNDLGIPVAVPYGL